MSDDLKINMDDERRYVSVTININKLFVEDQSSDLSVYEHKIIDSLKMCPLSITEISQCLGYKSISKKLRDTINNIWNIFPCGYLGQYHLWFIHKLPKKSVS